MKEAGIITAFLAFIFAIALLLTFLRTWIYNDIHYALKCTGKAAIVLGIVLVIVFCIFAF